MSEEHKKSKYQRAGKKPHVYSTTYRSWKAVAVKEGADSRQAVALSCHHAKSMGVVNARCTEGYDADEIIGDAAEVF